MGDNRIRMKFSHSSTLIPLSSTIPKFDLFPVYLAFEMKRNDRSMLIISLQTKNLKLRPIISWIS